MYFQIKVLVDRKGEINRFQLVDSQKRKRPVYMTNNDNLCFPAEEGQRECASHQTINDCVLEL